MGSKLPKRILRMKGKTMKQKWALHKRGGGKTKTYKTKAKKRSYSRTASNPGRKKAWGIGRYIHAARVGDVVSRVVQGKVGKYGFTERAGKAILSDYTAGASEGQFSGDKVKNVYGGMASGLIVDYGKSKAGVYRGLGKGKIIDAAIATSPEWQALQYADPTKNFAAWNDWRAAIDSGYSPAHGQFKLLTEPGGSVAKAFVQDKIVCGVLKVVQKVVFNTNGPIKLNARLPKGVNF